MFVSFLFLQLFLCSDVRADTPANCTYEDVRGTWLFSIGKGGNDNTINCSLDFQVVSKLKVQLLFPDVAVDSDGNVGFWTMIYNQGFEVQINGSKYFAFSAYKKSGKEVTSYCDKTLNGWSHEAAALKPSNWACYKGEQQSTLNNEFHNFLSGFRVICSCSSLRTQYYYDPLFFGTSFPELDSGPRWEI